MKERIKTLLNRSGGEFYEGFAGSPNTIKFTEEQLATFVGLMVKECRIAIRSNYVGLGTTEAVVSVEKHFGIDEFDEI